MISPKTNMVAEKRYAIGSYIVARRLGAVAMAVYDDMHAKSGCGGK